MKNNTWELVLAPQNVKIICNLWVFIVKLKSDTSLERYKSRLVTKENHQTEEIDYIETFILVVKTIIIRIVLIVAIMRGYSVRQLDVNHAFFNEYLQKKMYMTQPKGLY